MLVGCHHLGDRWRAGLKGHEQKAVPLLERHRLEPELLRLQSGIFMAVRHSDQMAVASIAPRMIRAGQHLGAAGITVDKPRAPMPADVRECANLAVIAANDDDALTEIFERPPLARLRDLTFVADDLRRRAQERLLLRLEEFRVMIE